MSRRIGSVFAGGLLVAGLLMTGARGQTFDPHQALREVDQHMTRSEQRAASAEVEAGKLRKQVAQLTEQVKPDVTLTQGMALHVRDPQAEPPAGVSWDQWLSQDRNWDFGDGSVQARMEGFNAGHIYDEPGVYRISYNGSAAATVAVRPAAEPVVFKAGRAWSELDSLLKDNAVVALERGAVYDVPYGVKATVKARNVLITAAGDPSLPPPMIRIERSPEGQKTPGRAFLVPKEADGVTIQDLAFDTPGTRGIKEKIGSEAVWVGGKNVSVRRCTFYDLTNAVMGEGQPTQLYVADNIVPGTDYIRGYFLWVTRGNGTVVLRNRVPDSVIEHPIRLRWCDYTTARDNVLGNSVKGGCIEMQAGLYHYATHNTIDEGVIRTGNLDSSSADDDASVSRWVVIADNAFTGNSRIVVSRGARDVLITRNAIDTSGNGVAIDTGRDSRWSERILVRLNHGKKLPNLKWEKRSFVSISGNHPDEARVENSDWD